MPAAFPRTVLVVGGGLVGSAIAWRLQRSGHSVRLIDPDPAAVTRPMEGSGPGSGSRAALGVLMAQVFHRSSGRGWRLRQRSLDLWRQWRRELASRGHDVPWRPGLLLLAATAEERERQHRLALERQAGGLPLQIWSRERIEALAPALPDAAVGGLYSGHDGQLDPVSALAALRQDGADAGVTLLADRAAALERRGETWRVWLGGGGTAEADWLVVSAGTAGTALLRGVGREDWPIEPVLGQALELELAAGPEGPPQAPATWNWPGAVVWQGVNLVPRPDLSGGRRFWMGATLEPGTTADPLALAALRDLGGHAPAWLRQSRVVRQWQGIRPRPVGRPAPLLETIAPHLLLAGGHHRNGVLLAPGTAEWVLEQVEATGPRTRVRAGTGHPA